MSEQELDQDPTPTARLDFVGEAYDLDAAGTFVIGREGDLAFDDNPYLHRHFLTVSHHTGMWWLANVGARIAATMSDPDGRMQAWLAPGAALPLVFDRTVVIFSAGPTTYELEIQLGQAPFMAPPVPMPNADGTTIGAVTFTPDQLLLIIALAEPALRREGWGSAVLPSSQQAAQRLGWELTRFNRKLDNVCEKLTKIGVKGLHGGPRKLAGDRRIRLVEYALAARWVTSEHLPLLERAN
jgi:hypothetical protein